MSLMAGKHYVIATQNGYLDGEFHSKEAAVKALAAEVRDAAQACRRSHKTCSVVGSAREGSVQIKVGGRQGYHLWQRYVINERPGARRPSSGGSAFSRELAKMRTDAVPVQHATRKKSPAQLDREISHALKTAAPCCAHAGRPGHRAHATKAGSIDAGTRGPSGKQVSQSARRANDQIYDLVNNKYFQSIPNDQLFKIVKDAGFRFDPEEEEFFLVGRDGNASWHLRDVSGRPVNHMLVLQWHKMDRTGRYEVVAYIS